MNESAGSFPRWRELLRYLRLTAAIAAITAAVMLFLYGSLDACEWVYRDFSRASGIPRDRIADVIEERSGVHNPSWIGCFRGWVRIKVYGLPPSLRMLADG